MHRGVSTLKNQSLLNVLADPVRLSILMQLMMKEMTGKQLADQTRLSQPNIHRHLKILLSSKLVILARTRVKGNIIEKYYKTAISDEMLEANLASSLPQKEKALMAASLAGALMSFINQSVRIMEKEPEKVENYPIGAQINVFPARNETKMEVTKAMSDTGKRLQEILRKHRPEEGERKFVSLLVTLPYE